MGGVPGVLPAKVAIIGGGVVGINSIKMAVGLGANVVVLDRNLDRLRYLDDIFGSKIKTLVSNPYTVQEAIADSDLVIGAVLIPGASAPRLVTREMLETMHQGAVIVDVAVDQGGCIETTRPTTHSNPTFYVDDVLHYCVANMPGAVPRTSTFALTNATLPFALDTCRQRIQGRRTGSIPHLQEWRQHLSPDTSLTRPSPNRRKRNIAVVDDLI